MSYYSEMAARQAYSLKTIDRIVEKLLRAKDEEIASLKEQLNTVLEGTVSLASYEAIVEEADEARALNEEFEAECEKLRDENNELKQDYVKVKGLLVNEGRVVDSLVEEKIQAFNKMHEKEREVARLQEHADKMKAAWQAVSKEVSEYSEEIMNLRNELAAFQAATKDLTLEDISLARRFKTMRVEQLEFQQHYDGYERVMKVWFAVYPDAKPMKANDLWKFLRNNL